VTLLPAGEVVVPSEDGVPEEGLVLDPAAATVTATFMPLPQWPGTPQMK
jgi:hypothetical protein